MSASELNEKRTKDRARQALYRQKKERGKSKKQLKFIKLHRLMGRH